MFVFKNGWISSEKPNTVAHHRHLTNYMRSRPQSSNVTSYKKKQMMAMKQSIDSSQKNNLIWNYDQGAGRLNGSHATGGIGNMNITSQ